MAREQFLRRRIRRDHGNGAVRQPLCGKGAHLVRDGKSVGQEELRRHPPIQLVPDLLHGGVPRIGSIEALSRRDVRPREGEAARRRLMQQGDIDVRRVLQLLAEEGGAGRHDPHDLARSQSLCLRIADLLGNGDLEPLRDEARDVAVCRMVRHAAHGVVVEITAAAREREPEFLCRDLRVVKEHLVEVAETEKEQLARMRLLCREILLHHRCDIL